MTPQTDIMLSKEYNELVDIASQTWDDEKPGSPDKLSTEWTLLFYKKCESEIIDCYMRWFDIVNQPPTVQALIQFDSIEWDLLVKIILDKHLDSWIDTFIASYEQEQWDKMTEEEIDDYYRELKGDQDYEDYVDRLINGEL